MCLLPTPVCFQMAAAGFVRFPVTRGDDNVMCPYCDISLDGWEKTDDPMYVRCIRFRSSDEQSSFYNVSAEKNTKNALPIAAFLLT